MEMQKLNTLRQMLTGSITTLSLLACSSPLAWAHSFHEVEFGEIITGFNSQYHEQPAGSLRQDLSGAAADYKRIIFVDDGGSPPEFSFVRVMSELPDTGAIDIPLTLNHEDLEGATYHNGYFIITTSMSAEIGEAQRRLTRFKLNWSGNQLKYEKSVDNRDGLMEALRQQFGDEWFNRIKDEPGRAGGLNIEGLSRPNTWQDFILLGLRSPLLGDNFGNPATDPGLNLDEGMAIIAKVHHPFDANPTFDFQTLDLLSETGSHGIRGMEWIPAMGSYVIIGGPVPAADNYSLWQLTWNGTLKPLELPGFENLCRPESVMQIKEGYKEYLVVLSEESGAACNNVPYTFIMAEILDND
jgi:hypothetical protein